MLQPAWAIIADRLFQRITEGRVPAHLFQGPFYFLRHGESEANIAGLIAGSTETPLTARGHAQAEAAAQVLARLDIRSIYCSPQQRAADTAAPIARQFGLPVTTLDGLRERHWGVLELKPLEEIRDRSQTAPQGESLAGFEDRTWQALESIDGPSPVLVVAHSGTMRVLRVRLGIGDVHGWVPNASPIRFAPPDEAAGPSGQPWRFEMLEG
jgi:probable phosphoglycerate mutase